jgi:hypothetical protein
MAGDYEKAITIQRALRQIVERRYLLPAIQRKFEWDCDRVCALFDSIMRGYPINTFMLWEVKDANIKKNFKFYQFLEKYCEWFAEDNPDFPTTGHGDFHAVIDGQQRLTSLYIGLKGTYAYKLPRKHFPKMQDDTVFPPRKLYLNLGQALDEESNEAMMMYDFQFLTDDECVTKSKSSAWFLVGDILDFGDVEADSDVLDVVMGHLDAIGQSANTYARQTLTKLYFKVRREPLIHYYNESSQKIDHVLDIFIRTNHGGKPLSYSDLLMSIAVANWQADARQQIDNLIKSVRQSADMEFLIDRDWVLKAALMLIDADVRFRVGNFSGDTVTKIESEWEEIKACILATFRLIHLMGLKDESLRAKNAAIPVAYYLYHKGRDASSGQRGLFSEINNLAKCSHDRQLISQWLMMSLLKGVFGGQGDGLLSTLRKVIRDNLHEDGFPLQAIINEYKGKTKDLSFDEEFIARLLKTQKDDASCYAILALLMPDRICTGILHKDHLHPAAEFTAERLQSRKLLATNPELRKFFENPENWNGIANLHLLDGAMNQSKQDQPLAEWLADQRGLTPAMLMIPTETKLDFESFPIFVQNRTAYLSAALKTLSEAPGKLSQAISMTYSSRLPSQEHESRR